MLILHCDKDGTEMNKTDSWRTHTHAQVNKCAIFMHSWIEVCAVCEMETALYVGILSISTKCVWLCAIKVITVTRKKQCEFISFICQCMFIHKYLRFSSENVPFRRKFQRRAMESKREWECKRSDVKSNAIEGNKRAWCVCMLVFSNPIHCKWPFWNVRKGSFKLHLFANNNATFVNPRSGAAVRFASQCDDYAGRMNEQSAHILDCSLPGHLCMSYEQNPCWNAIRSVLQSKQFLNIIVYDCDELSQWDFTSNVEVHVEWHNSTEI